MKYLKASIFLSLFFWCTFSVAQFQIPDKPEIETSVYDYVDLLSQSQAKNLEQQLIQYSDSTSTQIVIAVISTTKGEDINFLGANWGQAWGIGQKGKDNGILILMAKDDRKIGINTGYGVEGALTDAISRRIIENVILPEFKQENYYGGLKNGAHAIFQVLNGEFQEERIFENGEGFPFQALLPIIIFIVILIILSSKNRNNRSGRGGGKKTGFDLWDVIILSNMGRGGSSSGGFGSGGSFGGGGGFSGGFGGGGFGGGGASGGW